MRENMVRTQVYLPRDIYERLQKRAEENDLTLAVQVREALVDYLERVESQDDDGILHADDPIFQMIGMFSSKEGDLSVNHDHYLYGWPKREESGVLREKPAQSYKSKSTAKKSKRK
jgi:N-acetyl-beta-hexosaminidase